jgi:hypothetical protein
MGVLIAFVLGVWLVQTGEIHLVGLLLAGLLALRLGLLAAEGAFHLTRAWDPRAALLFWIAAGMGGALAIAEAVPS